MIFLLFVYAGGEVSRNFNEAFWFEIYNAVRS